MTTEDIKELKALIQQADIKGAFNKLFGVINADTDPERHGQVTMYAAQFNDISKKERMGLIDFGEASVVKNRVTYSLIELLSEAEKETLQARKRVFISYNHKDAAIAGKLKELLVKEGIAVTIDSEAMGAGENIKQFIEKCVRDTETTLSIVSKNSLLSAWVAMETLNTFGLQMGAATKKFIPCYIEPDFFDNGFTDASLALINKKISDLAAIIENRVKQGLDSLDVNDEYSRLIKLRNALGEIVGHLRNSLCIDISEGKIETNLPKIIQKIKE